MFKWLQLEMEERKRRKAEDDYWRKRARATEVTTLGRSTSVTVYPNHHMRDRRVLISIATETPHEVWYHFFSPEGALALLTQLEQERQAIETLANKPIDVEPLG